jgi:hypothetical protein
LADVFIFSLIFSQALFISTLSSKFSKAENQELQTSTSKLCETLCSWKWLAHFDSRLILILFNYIVRTMIGNTNETRMYNCVLEAFWKAFFSLKSSLSKAVRGICMK